MICNVNVLFRWYLTSSVSIFALKNGILVYYWRCGHVVGGTQWNKDLAQQLPSSVGTQHGFALPPAIHCLSQTKRSHVLEQKSLDIADLSCTPTYQTLKHPITSESLQKTKQNCGGGKKKQGAKGQHIGRRSVLLSQEEIHKMCWNSKSQNGKGIPYHHQWLWDHRDWNMHRRSSQQWRT